MPSHPPAQVLLLNSNGQRKCCLSLLCYSVGSVAGYNPSEADLDDVDEVGSVVSQGSVISLMSCQSAQSSSGFGYVPENTLRRNDYKRHSMSSLRKFQNGGGLAGQRNSASRRSAIIPRYNPRMSAIEEYSRKSTREILT